MIDIYLCDDDASARSRIQTILEKKILIEDYDMQLVCSSDSAEALLHALGDRRQNLYLLDVETRSGTVFCWAVSFGDGTPTAR